MDCQKIFVHNMKCYRQFLGMSQEQLAHNSGLDMSYIGRIERMVVCPTINTIEKIAVALNVDVALMFSPNFLNLIDDYAIVKIKNGRFVIRNINKDTLDKKVLRMLDELCDN